MELAFEILEFLNYLLTTNRDINQNLVEKKDTNKCKEEEETEIVTEMTKTRDITNPAEEEVTGLQAVEEEEAEEEAEEEGDQIAVEEITRICSEKGSQESAK